MVSVIIPNYNHAVYLEQRIDSVLNQTHQDFELILLDDCSRDNSREILAKYKDNPKVSHIVFNEVNSGSPFAQWRKGLDLAQGDIIWIAESDDYCAPIFLEVLLPALSDKKVGISFCSSYWVDDQNNIKEDLSLYKDSFCTSGQDVYINELVYKCVIQNVSSALFRRDIFSSEVNELGKYRYCGDWNLYAALAMNQTISYNASKLNYFRWYHQNTSHEAISLGKWTDEGVHVLRFLSQSTLVTLGRIYRIYVEWNRRINNITDSKRRTVARKHLLNYCFKGAVHTAVKICRR